MRYVLLTYGEEPLPPVETTLAPVATATTVRVRDGETLIADGPFADAEETLGGFSVISAESLDEAIERAARLPAARRGAVEIRPVDE
jgi:hypothetical protein